MIITEVKGENGIQLSHHVMTNPIPDPERVDSEHEDDEDRDGQHDELQSVLLLGSELVGEHKGLFLTERYPPTSAIM